ncbi:hypothetical protein ACKLTP_07015 [Paenarthrobacter ureafaciens]|uniref:hypothetical protein n=1 Tax=Paenarthrobacter TaxID=1742992 RepID=UPI001AD57122|nr:MULTISPECIES: hypothetical protein [Paenarthrobacter]MBN9131541.1 hypothetical protein [Paenarthrobacter ureafaciens]MCW3768146.1 hypothetical protein [Paenarthrobacter sp. PAE-2]
MLKILVRFAAVAIAALIALVAGVYSAAADLDGLPDADYVASMRFDNSPMPRGEVIASLDQYADSAGVGIIRVASAPDDFLDKRLAFVFGSGGIRDTEIDWFSPTMSGTVAKSSELGFTSLNGVYAIKGSDSQAKSFQTWAKSELGADAALKEKTTVGLLTYALLTVGAWVPMSAAILLLGAIVMSWYVLRAHGRELRVLAGMRLSTVVLTDLRSLFGALAVPVVATFAISVLGIIVTGFGRAGFFISTLMLFTGAVTAFAVAVALIMGMLSLPTVRDIAARRPSERGSWVISEVLKVAAVVIVAAIVPTAAGVVTNASAATAQGALWESMGDSVTVRVANRLGDAENAAFAGLIRDLVRRDAAMFSMSLSSDTVNLVDEAAGKDLEDLGFDSVVLTGEPFLDTVNRAGGATWELVSAVHSVQELPDSIRGQLLPNLELWSTSRNAPDVRFYSNTGEAPIAVSGGMAGTLDTNQRPLIISVNDLTQFDDAFLASAMSRGNIVFTDPEQLKALVEQRGISSEILSIDRIADLGLYDAQSKQRNAQLAAAAIALAVLALVMCLAVTAWIFALLRRRRWFVQHTAGISWRSILQSRMMWEAGSALLFGAVMAMSFAAISPSIVWISATAPFAYMGLTWLIHQWAAATTFRTTLARRG